ncbi:MAG TPA: chemotaxis protein CheA [Mobilitalea sp.]|nr:chemotaxis protein CheA [Mobilitalea sp.]
MISKIYTEDIVILKEFLDKCASLMGNMEKDIVRLETGSGDKSLYDCIYKNINIIRKGSSFFGLTALLKVTNEMNFIMGRITAGPVLTGHIDALLLSLDFLNSYIIRLGSKLQVISVSGNENGKFIEFAPDSKEEQILGSIEKIHKQYESEDGLDRYRKTDKTDEDSYDVLLSEGLQSKIEEDVREQFVFENAEHLELIENNILIRLDNDNNDKESINEIFRVVHSIKGGTGVYLSTLSPEDPHYEHTKNFLEVVHSFENLLSLIRDKQYAFDKNLVNLSFRVIDFFKSFIQFIGLGEGNIENYKEIAESINFEISNLESLPAKSGQESTTVNYKDEADKNRKYDDIPGHKKANGNITQSIRVRQEKIDAMMNIISELVTAKNSFAHISEKLGTEYNLPEISKEIKQVEAYVNRISDELQNSIMSIRMVEIRTVFQKMPRVVRDIAQNSGKNIELIIEGEDTEIDKSIIEHISDPLVHIIRNSTDHGIEPYEERISIGKPGKGKIILRAYNKNKYVYIEVEDDGRGIDPEKIKEKALAKELISEAEAEKMNNKQLINLIFIPGFSTANQVTEVSGRGVGMDIVKSNISKINGSVTVESEIGKGTKMVIRLPLSLAISRGLIVEAEGTDFIIPLESIVETVKVSTDKIHHFNGRYFTYLRGTVIGMEWISKIFMLGKRDTLKKELNAVILTNGTENIALVVDKLKKEQEFVMKPLEGHLASIPGISGSTILGNGKVVLIVNPSDLIKLSGL